MLSAKGLVAARPRVGTAVRPRDDWNLLDADMLVWSTALAPDLDFIQALMEARQLFEPAAAAFAARRTSAPDLARIEAAFAGMRAALPHDIGACCRADVAFHTAIIEGSHNAVLRQLIGTIGAALESVFRLSTEGSRPSYRRTLAAHERVLDRIRGRDPAAARAAMAVLLEVAASDLAPLLAGRRDRRASPECRAAR